MYSYVYLYPVLKLKQVIKINIFVPMEKTSARQEESIFIKNEYFLIFVSVLHRSYVGMLNVNSVQDNMQICVLSV